MSKKITFLTIFSVILLFPFISKAAVVINEIMYDLDGSDSGREWIEVINNSDTAVNLTDWKFFEAETNHKLTLIQGDSNIPAYGYAIIADNSGNFLTDNPGFSGILFDSTFSLSNTGENLALKNNDNIVDEITYNSSWGANGDGKSLQRKNPGGNSNDSTSWGTGNPTPGVLNNFSADKGTSGESGTTPTPPAGGSSNQPPIADAGNDIIAFIDQEITFDGSKSHDPDGNDLAYEWNLGEGGVKSEPMVKYKYSYPGTYLVTLMVFDGRYYTSDTITVEIYHKKITINEFLPSPEGKDEEEEWIELYNDSEQIVNISGWQLDDEDSGSKPFVFPENTLITSYGYLVISRQVSGISLNNDKDKVRLLLSTGVIFQEISYEKAPEGKSSARTGEGFVWSMPTPGLPNIIGLSTNQDINNNKPLETFNATDSKNAVSFQNNSENPIKGGWTTLSQSKSEENQKNYYNLANLEKSANENKLILIIITLVVVILAAGIGFLKLKKKI